MEQFYEQETEKKQSQADEVQTTCKEPSECFIRSGPGPAHASVKSDEGQDIKESSEGIMITTVTGTGTGSLNASYCHLHGNYYYGSCAFCQAFQFNTAMNYGWRCPKCTAVMAPWSPSCVNCKGHADTNQCSGKTG